MTDTGWNVDFGKAQVARRELALPLHREGGLYLLRGVMLDLENAAAASVQEAPIILETAKEQVKESERFPYQVVQMTKQFDVMS